MSDRDRDKISFSELDKRRRGGRTDPARRSNGSSKRSRWASDAYKRRVDEQLFGNKKNAARLRMEERLRSAANSPALLRTYREYVRDFGMPDDFSTLVLLLDLEDEREGLKVLEALEAGMTSATVDQKNLLRGRLRNLEMSTASDAIADAAVDLLGRL